MIINEILKGTAINMFWITGVVALLYIMLMIIKGIIRDIFSYNNMELIGTHKLSEEDFGKTLREIINEDFEKENKK